MEGKSMAVEVEEFQRERQGWLSKREPVVVRMIFLLTALS
jgi:hypothetical protein